jgi:glutamine synthetase
MANQLIAFKKDVDAVIKKNVEKDEAIFQVLVDYIKKSKKILFEGNGYSDEWVKEAEKRGLNNIKTTPQALDAYVSDKTLKLFEDLNIMTHREQEARHAIYLETYTKKIQIEGRVMGDLAMNQIIPTAIKYQKMLVDNVSGMKNILDGKEFNKLAAPQIEMIKEISEHIAVIKKGVEEMTEERKKANQVTDHRKQAIAYCDKVKAHFDDIRYHVDKLEQMVDDESWPLPKYREMLFTK